MTIGPSNFGIIL